MDSRILEKYFLVLIFHMHVIILRYFDCLLAAILAPMQPLFFGESKDDQSAAIRDRLPYAPVKGDRPRMALVIKMENPYFYIGRSKSTEETSYRRN